MYKLLVLVTIMFANSLKKQIYHKKNISEEKDFQIFFDALVVSPITYQAKEYNDEYKVHE